ncbi:MAG: hypothetical protein NTZ21_10990 [Actinobacteria bacterium]|nr:hypothetical protein [Actinomycetota bacterium]
MTISALALLCFGGLAAAPAGVAGASGSAGDARVEAESCEDVTYRWGGDVVLDAAAPSYATGVEVPTVDGATLTVVGVSADGLDDAGGAHLLDVHVGGMRAAAGAAIAGGQLVVSSTSPSSRRVVGVTVVVRRCAVVASATAAPSGVATTAVSTTAAPTAPTAVSTTSAGPAAGTSTGGASAAGTAAPTLPATGADEWRQSLIGAVVIGAGVTLVSLGRRRPANR